MGGYFPAYGAGGYPAAVAAQLAAAQQSSQVGRSELTNVQDKKNESKSIFFGND